MKKTIKRLFCLLLCTLLPLSSSALQQMPDEALKKL